MKNTLTILIFLMLGSMNLYGQTKVEIIDYVGTELQFIINRSSENNQFSKYYSLQYHGTTTTSFLTSLNNFTLNSVSPTHISITANNGQTIVFSIQNEDTNANVIGYGFGEHHGAFSFNHQIDNPFIWDLVVQEKKNPKPKDFDCDSGGEGANQCSTEGGIATVSTGCSVTCNVGYYACCDQSKAECKCFNATTHEPDIDINQPIHVLLFSATSE